MWVPARAGYLPPDLGHTSPTTQCVSGAVPLGEKLSESETPEPYSKNTTNLNFFLEMLEN